MDATAVHPAASTAVFRVNFDETMVKFHIVPSLVKLALLWALDRRVDTQWR